MYLLYTDVNKTEHMFAVQRQCYKRLTFSTSKVLWVNITLVQLSGVTYSYWRLGEQCWPRRSTLEMQIHSKWFINFNSNVSKQPPLFRTHLVRPFVCAKSVWLWDYKHKLFCVLKKLYLLLLVVLSFAMGGAEEGRLLWLIDSVEQRDSKRRTQRRIVNTGSTRSRCLLLITSYVCNFHQGQREWRGAQPPLWLWKGHQTYLPNI